MEKVKLIIDWCIAHPAVMTTVAVALYPALDAVVRLIIPADKVTQWEKTGGIVFRSIAKVYRLLEKGMTINR